MVDKSVLRNKINFINESLNKLNSLRQLNKDEFLNNFQAVDSSKYNLQVAIEAIIDIASHIIAREKMGVPATSKTVMLQLLSRSSKNNRLSQQAPTPLCAIRCIWECY